MALVA
jgi:hypothetical protein